MGGIKITKEMKDAVLGTYQVMDGEWIEPNESGINEKTCTHRWEKYVGFRDTFEYCTKCDCKRGG